MVPLDDRRRWYRYHHLFADVLRAHLLVEQPGRVAGLHRRASDWYDAAGRPVPAVRHALAAGDVDRAADLVELAVPALARERREVVIRGWVDDLPADGAAQPSGPGHGPDRWPHVQQRVRRRRGAAGATSSDSSLLEDDQLVVLDRDEWARLPARIEMYRAALALNAGDPAGTIDHAGRALGAAVGDDDLVRAAASALSGLASWTIGDLDTARRGYAAALEGLRRAGHVADVLGCSIALADLAMTQGRLGEAQRAFEDALDLGRSRGTRPCGARADMLVGLARVAWERDDMVAAAAHLRAAEDLGDAAALAQNPYRWRVAMAGLRAAEGARTSPWPSSTRPSGCTSATTHRRTAGARRARTTAGRRRVT